MSNAIAITALPVQRDDLGHWTHPAWPATEDESLPKGWFAEQRLELAITEFEMDAPQALQDAYYEQGNPDCSSWNPTAPIGNGWFVFSIHDTEDGPVCVWVRPAQVGNPAGFEWPTLEKPAKVGAGTFCVGVSTRQVVEAAQRLYQYEQDPPFSKEQIESIRAHMQAEPVEQAPSQDEKVAFEDWYPLGCPGAGVTAQLSARAGFRAGAAWQRARTAQTEQHIQIAGQRLYEELRQWLATEHDPDSQAALQAWREAIVQTAPQHPDDEAVDRFAAAMKAKLAAARAKGRGGWENKELVGDDRLAEMLIEHLSKGNAGTFEDVANFAMMLHQRGADPKLLAEELVEAQRAQAALNTVIDYMLGAGRHEEPLEFLRCWNEGNFDSLREEWPEAPLAIYYADPLADHAAIDAALAKARQAEEGEAL